MTSISIECGTYHSGSKCLVLSQSSRTTEAEWHWQHFYDMQAFVAAHTGSMTRTYSLQLAKGKRDRVAEDAVASKLLLNAVAAACGLPQSSHVDLGLSPDSEHVQV